MTKEERENHDTELEIQTLINLIPLLNKMLTYLPLFENFDSLYDKIKYLNINLEDAADIERRIDSVDVARLENSTEYCHEMAVLMGNFCTKCEKIVLGTINGNPLNEDDEYYQNNAKYFYEQILCMLNKISELE